ncbi:hypothetical protein [Streptomyces sp. NBC_01727]|uniref:hypothetical protein n=1 Tax=Streptomyces sp. NBC_01727 TaxID=2975924 RepID=UPI002E15B0AB|nr:hypothetical protein OIE76_36865 [Streptomyces sp. NBC_01727]
MHTDGVMDWLRGRLGRAVAVSYLAALLLPGPGLWLRHPHTLPRIDLTLHAASLLLSLLLRAVLGLSGVSPLTNSRWRSPWS